MPRVVYVVATSLVRLGSRNEGVGEYWDYVLALNDKDVIVSHSGFHQAIAAQPFFTMSSSIVQLIEDS